MSTDEEIKNLRCEIGRLIDYCASCQMVDAFGTVNWLDGLCRRLTVASKALHDGDKFSTYVREGHPTIIVRESFRKSRGD